ncbi:MAG: hypothetical protein Salg2KO_04020 [Salibacteraceae bacterium]
MNEERENRSDPNRRSEAPNVKAIGAFCFMAHYVYILYSASIDKYYIGESENVKKRLVHHNSEMNQNWTRRGRPWHLVKEIEFADSKAASKAERFIKRQKSRKFIEKIVREGWSG